MSEEPHRENTCITPRTGELGLVGGMVTVWRSALFARGWFEDSKREVAQSGVDARRREILFAVCFAESYIVEWVRDEALKRKFALLDEYFPLDDRRGVIDRWKEVPKLLRERDVIPAHPDYGQKFWFDFTKLVDYRNGLVHASASRPQADNTPPAAMPRPSPDDLNQMPPGHPTRIVVALVRELHASVGTESPKP